MIDSSTIRRSINNSIYHMSGSQMARKYEGFGRVVVRLHFTNQFLIQSFWRRKNTPTIFRLIERGRRSRGAKLLIDFLCSQSGITALLCLTGAQGEGWKESQGPGGQQVELCTPSSDLSPPQSRGRNHPSPRLDRCPYSWW